MKPAEPITAGNTVDIGMHIDGAQVRFTSLALRDLLRIANRMRTDQIEGPDWIVSERYDVSAKLPEGARRDQVPEMLLNLLTERFQIVSHRTTKEFPVLALVVAKSGLKVKQSAPEEGDGTAPASTNIAASGGPAGVSVSFGRGAYYTFSNGKFEAKHLTMGQIADSLSRYEPETVLDMTEQPGYYDFVLQLSPEDYQGMLIRAAISAGVSLPPQVQRMVEMSNGDSLGAALETVGLKLERRRAPLEVVIVEKANKVPSAN